MAYRYGDRVQVTFLPPCIEEYVPKDDPVRAYNVFVDALDFNDLGITIAQHNVGNSTYDPVAMLKLLVYGYSYGWRSSRKLERAVCHNLSFIWLMGGLKPDHKTISEFRKNNKSALQKVLKQCARLCIALNLIDGNTLFTDGTKIRASANIKNSWTEEKCDKVLKRIDSRIDKILSESASIDKQEQNEQSLVNMQKELKDQKKLKAKVKEIIAELKQTDKKSLNTTDPECSRMNSVQGSHAGYNAQTVVDEKHGLIVSSDVVNDNNDRNQFLNQINQANETLEKNCRIACADKGYSTVEELEQVASQDITVIVPPCEKSDLKKEFKYDNDADCYICPQGNILINRGLTTDKKSNVYKIEKKSICFSCSRFGECTKSKNGKSVSRLINEEARQRHEDKYNETTSQEIYKLRCQKVELPFGHIKRNLGVNAFLLRGLDGVKAEMSLFSTCFNLRRMITLIGCSTFIETLTA